MATFNPFNKSIKESINVDFKDRHSPQKVILCNRENQFYGEFVGAVKATELDVDGGTFSNVQLSNVSLIDKDGKEWDLSQINQDITDLKAEIHQIKEDQMITALCVEISGNTELIRKLSADLQTVSTTSDGINDLLNAERVQRRAEDDELRHRIDSATAALSGVDQFLSSEISSLSKSGDDSRRKLEQKLLERIDSAKHYQIEYPSRKDEFRTGYLLKDWCSNILDGDIPYGYVRTVEQLSETRNGGILGKLTGVQIDEEGTVRKFIFTVFDGCPYVELKPGSYRFGDGVTEIPTGYNTYKLRWDGNSTDQFRMTLVGVEPYKYLQATTVDADGETKNVGKVTGFLSSDDGHRIESGSITFDTILTQNLAGFNGIEFKFDSENRRSTFRGEDGTDRVVEFNKDDNSLVLMDNFEADMYQPIEDVGVEFARVYDSGIKYVDGLAANGLESLTVRLSTEVDGEGLVKDVELNKKDGFKAYVGQGNLFVRYLQDDIEVVDEHVTYGTSLFAFDGDNATVLSNQVVGTLSIDTENVSDVQDGSIQGFTVVIRDGTLSGQYSLSRSTQTESELFVCTKTLSDGSKVSLRYDARNIRNFIQFTHVGEVTVLGHFFVDVSNVDVVHDGSVTKMSGKLEKDADGRVQFPNWDMHDTVTYTVSIGTEVLTSQSEKEYNLHSRTGQPVVNVTVPQRLGGGRAREFIVSMDMTSPYPNTFTKLNVMHDDDTAMTDAKYSFRMDGEDVSDKLFVVGSKARLRFTEVDVNQFVVEDMENATLLNRIDERIRGGVNYRGVVQVVDDTDEPARKTEHLSNLFYYPSTDVPMGWEYPREEYKDPTAQLVNGSLFFVGKTPSTRTTRWTIEGVELEVGDYVIVNKDGVRIQNVRPEDIDVIDTVEKDRIVVDNIDVQEEATARDAVVENLSADWLSVRNEVVNILSAGSADVSSLSAKDATVIHETVMSADFVGTVHLCALADANEIFAGRLSAAALSVNSETVVETDIVKADIMSANVSVLNAADGSVEFLSVRDGFADSLCAVTLSVDDADLVSANIRFVSADSAKFGDVEVGAASLNLSNGDSVSSALDVSSWFQSEIDSLNRRGIGGVRYMGDVQAVDEPGIDKDRTLHLSNLFWIAGDDRNTVEGWKFPNAECSSYEHVLSVGEMFSVSRSRNTTSRKWTLSGGDATVEVGLGDCIFVKEGPVKIRELKVSNIHVIDSLDSVNPTFVGATVSGNLSVEDCVKSTDGEFGGLLSASNLSVDKAGVKELLVSDGHAEDLSVGNLSVAESVAAKTFAEKADFTDVSATSAEFDTETVKDATFTGDVSLCAETNAASIKAGVVTVESKLNSKQVFGNEISTASLSADIARVDEISAVRLSARGLEAAKISVSPSALVIGDARFSEICSTLSVGVSENATSAENLIEAANFISGIAKAVSEGYNKTLSSIAGDVPDRLMIRDMKDTNKTYLLGVCNGMLVIDTIEPGGVKSDITANNN